MADQSSPLQQSQPPPQDDYPPPPPPPPASSGMPSSPTGRSPPRGGRDRSLSPRRSPSRGRYYDDNRRTSYRDDDRYSSRGRYDPYSRRDDYYDSRDRYSDRYYQDRYDHHHHRGYDHRDRYHDRYDDRRGGGGGGGGRYPPKSRQRRPVDRGTEQERKSTTTIYAGNLPYDFIERDVASMFERYGRLKSITVPMDNMTNKNKGFAFVEFEERRDAEDAYEKFDGFSVEGRRLRLDWDIGLNKKDQHRPSSRRGPGGPPPPPMDDPRDRSLNDPYAAPPPPPPMDSRGYRRESPEPYRR